MNPFILIFASAFFGLLLGKIALGRFKVGVSGALFSGLVLVCLVGYAFGKCGLPIGNLGKFTLGSTGGVLFAALGL